MSFSGTCDQWLASTSSDSDQRLFADTALGTSKDKQIESCEGSDDEYELITAADIGE